jgi:hypothetical protein
MIIPNRGLVENLESLRQELYGFRQAITPSSTSQMVPATQEVLSERRKSLAAENSFAQSGLLLLYASLADDVRHCGERSVTSR